MAKTKICPKCGAKTKGAYFSSTAMQLVDFRGELMRDALGQPRLGIPSRKCRECAWVGDFILLPPSAPPIGSKNIYLDDIDDDDEDYINHYYH